MSWFGTEWQAVVEAALDNDCDCAACEAIRERLMDDPDTAHDCAAQPGVSILMDMTWQAKCEGCGWRGTWWQDREHAELDGQGHKADMLRRRAGVT